jgi:tetratricopeptide (TPR) repeat protein
MKKLFLLLISTLNLISCAEEEPIKFIPLTTESEAAKAAFKEGVYRDDQNEVNEAFAAYEKAIELDENFLLPRIFLNTGVRSENRERLLFAFENRLKASEIEQKIIEAAYQRTFYGDLKESIKIMDDLIKKYSDIPFLYEAVGNQKSFDKDFDGAIAAWNKALEINPKSYSAALRLGLLHVNVGTEFMMINEERRDVKEGEKWLLMAQSIRPEASASPRFLGNLYRTTYELEKALDAYKLAVEINTEKTSQLMEQTLMLAHTNAAMGNYELSRKYYKETIDLSINDYWKANNHNYYTLSLIFEKKYDEAIKFLSQAQETLKQEVKKEEVLEWGLQRVEFIKWLTFAHSQRKEETLVSQEKLNLSDKLRYETNLLDAVDDKEKERLERGYKGDILFRSIWSNILFGEYDSARESLVLMNDLGSSRLSENPDALNGFHALSGYLNLMEGNVEESLAMYEKRLERGDMNEYHKYFYALTLKANGNQEKSKDILVSLANNPFVDWTIAMVKNLAKAQIQTNI